MTTTALPVIDLGTHNRDYRTGRYVRTYTLRHTAKRNGTPHIIQRTIPATGIERLGRVLMNCADRGTVWNIEVLDKSGQDVTFDFKCFQDED